MIKPTDEMVHAFMRAYADADDGSPDVILNWTAERAGVAAVLAVVERDQAPTQDAYDAAVRALEKHRRRAAIHADTLATVLELLDTEPNHKIRDVIRSVIQEGHDRIAEDTP